MRHYCTVTDINYLPRALVLYESLIKHSTEPFTLYILPMDQECANTLIRMVLPKVQLMLGFQESHPGMQEARANRTHQEYCWTCASNFCEALLQTGIDEIVYLDADMIFFSDPKQVFDEIGERSIGIIPHRFIPEKAHLAVNGQFNVSWVSFKNTAAGRSCLSRWAAQVREKCSATDGCGDQLYLNSWPSNYGDEVHVIEHIGAGTAPWNVGNYSVTDGPSVDGLPIIFYHFHETTFNEDGSVFLSGYRLRDEDTRFIYEPYCANVQAARERINSIRSHSAF